MTITTNPTPIWRAQFWTNNDAIVQPCAGGTVATYRAGTLSPISTYQDVNASVQNPVVISLDEAGSANIWLDSTLFYKFIWYDSNGVQQGVQDDIPGSSQAAQGSLMPTGGTAGQYLAKIDSANYNTIWTTPTDGVLVVSCTSSRALTVNDNGLTLDCGSNVQLTVPTGLPENFSIAVLITDTVTIIPAAGVILNETTNNQVRTLAVNPIFAMIRRIAVDNFNVSGVA
jgi:hypothetical protein